MSRTLISRLINFYYRSGDSAEHRHSFFNSAFPRAVKHFVHQRGINGVNGRWLVKGLRGLAPFLIADDLAHAATEVIDFAERPPRAAGTVVKDEGDGGTKVAEFLTTAKFI